MYPSKEFTYGKFTDPPISIMLVGVNGTEVEGEIVDVDFGVDAVVLPAVGTLTSNRLTLY